MSKISNVNDEEYDGEKIEFSPVQEFYKNQSIFITGGTGFIGKTLIEKLLRSCSGISRIYVLIRKKKDQDLQQRLQNILEDTVFSQVRIAMPDFEKKIIGMAGDISLEKFGLSEADINLLKRDVSIIFHSAATVRFDESLKVAVATNLQSTVTMLDLCKDMKKLKAFVYVSTVYSHCVNNSIIEEKFYNYPTSYKDLLSIANLSDEIIETITPVLIKSWLNTYTCSKASAENFLADESQDLPVAIFRPSIVTASVYEPMPGWVDSYNGATGLLAGVATGVLRTVCYNAKKRVDLVPVDFTVNALIACAWDVDMQMTRRGKNMLIYNFSCASDAPITLSKMGELSLKYTKTYPFSMTLCYPSLRFNKYKFVNNFYKIFLHTIPAYFIDLLAQSAGKKPRMMKIYEKVDKMCDLIEYIGKNEWDIKNENVQRLWNELESSDQIMFQFTMQGFDWEKYFSTYVKGMRIYLFKDDLKTLDASRMKLKRLFLMDQVMPVALICSVYYILRKFWK